MDDDKSGIVFLFKPFLLVSCYPHGKVSGSDLKVDSEGVKPFCLSLDFTVHCQTHMFVLFTILYCTLSNSYVRTVHNIVLYIVTVCMVMYAC